MDAVVAACAERLSGDSSGEARRLFHGRGHCYPGYENVVVNWYPPYLLVSLYAETQESEVDRLVTGLCAVIDGVEGVAVQLRHSRGTTTQVKFGEVPDEHVVLEQGLKYIIQPKRNQNVGLFMDMAHVRAALAPEMAGVKMLNLFAYTCAFSVSAVAHGAELVVNNDMNANVLNIGKKNHMANGHDLRHTRMLAHNVFKAWKKIRHYGPYDVIVIDPPTNQRGSFVAEKHYPQLLKQLPSLAAPNARIIACLNSPFLGQDFVQNQMARWCNRCVLQKVYPPHPDFPEAFEGRGLKVQEYRYR